MRFPRIVTRTRSALLLVLASLVLATFGLTPAVANTSPLGTSYVAQVTNLPGDASAALAFDGLESPVGSSGLRVREKSTSFRTYQLIEFSLETANGESFVGQQGDPLAPASVSVSGLRWSQGGEAPTPARAEPDSAFLWLSVDGEAQALSDFANLELRFGTHPLDPAIPVVFIHNSSNAALQFDTGGRTALESLGVLVGPIAALQIDGIHLAVAAAPVPEPGLAVMVAAGVLGLLTTGLRQRRPRQTSESREGPRRPRLSVRFRVFVLAFMGLCLPGYYTGCDAAEDSDWAETNPVTIPPISSYFASAGPGSIATECLDIDGDVVSRCDDPGRWRCVTVTPDPGQTFRGWRPFRSYRCDVQASGPPPGCDGADQYLFTSAYSQRCVAEFCETRQLEVSVNGAGLVGSIPRGMSCVGETCTGYFCTGSDVQLVPQPQFGSGMIFGGWSGNQDCVDGNNFVTMTSDLSCTANFRQPEVSVQVIGAGRVTLGSSADGCREGSDPALCTSSVAGGLEETFPLTAVPDLGQELLDWEGACDGQTDNQANLTVDVDRACTATFSNYPGVGGPGVTEIVSLADDESLGNSGVAPDANSSPWLPGSADLSVVLFSSRSTNLVPGGPPTPNPDIPRIFARNRTPGVGTTQLLRQGTQIYSGEIGPIDVSADGRFALYQFGTLRPPIQPLEQLFRRDLTTGTEEIVSVCVSSPAPIGCDPFSASGAGYGTLGSLSGNGRHVAYLGQVPVPMGSGTIGVIVRDSCAGAAPAACTPHSAGIYDIRTGQPFSVYASPAPSLSRDGRYVAFRGLSSPSGVGIYLHDRDFDDDEIFDEPDPGATHTRAVVTGSLNPVTEFTPILLDASGRYVAFHSADTNLPGNAAGNLPFRFDTCIGAPPAENCTEGYTPLAVREDGMPLSFGWPTVVLSDLSASGRFAGLADQNLEILGGDPEVEQPSRIVRDTCLRAPGPCTARNVAVSRRRTDGSTVPFFGVYPPPPHIVVSDDGTLAALFGARSALPSHPNPSTDEVLLAVTGIERDLGGPLEVTTLRPASVAAGTVELLISVLGQGFVPGTRVTWNGVSLPTIYVSPRKLQAWVSASELGTAGNVDLRAVNPSGADSGEKVFTVTQ